MNVLVEEIPTVIINLPNKLTNYLVFNEMKRKEKRNN